MRQFVHRHLLLPAFETRLKRRKIFPYWRELEKSQWLPRSELERLQHQSLCRLVEHAFENCPYYRKAWGARGLHPSALQRRSDFEAWPVITREEVRQNRLEIRATVPGLKLLSKATGGSSGVPLQFDLDQGSYDRRFAAWHRGYAWAGAAPGTRQLYLWGVALGSRRRGTMCPRANRAIR